MGKKDKFVDEKARVLIVEDDESIRKVLATILEDEGYNVESVETAKKGMEKARVPSTTSR